MLTHKNFLNIAREVSSWSKCVSKQVWAVIVRDNRILSIWYNWTPSWYINCHDVWWWKWSKDHHDWALKYEIHAEMNALLWAARNWVSIDWSILYCTLEPCFQCTKNMVAAGIKEIYYEDKYDKMNWTDEAEKFIKENWLIIKQIDTKN